MGYTGYWSAKDHKRKGSGVAILVKKEWARYVGSVKRINAYLIKIILYMKGISIKIIQIYSPPQDDNMKLLLCKKIKELHVNKDKTRTLIMGDFNIIRNIDLDKKGGASNKIRQDILINTLLNRNYIDVFRELHPTQRDFTWSNKRIGDDNIQTRIDYIWADKNWGDEVLTCDIIDSELITDSDHNIVLSTINTSNTIRNNK